MIGTCVAIVTLGYLGIRAQGFVAKYLSSEAISRQYYDIDAYWSTLTVNVVTGPTTVLHRTESLSVKDHCPKYFGR